MISILLFFLVLLNHKSEAFSRCGPDEAQETCKQRRAADPGVLAITPMTPELPSWGVTAAEECLWCVQGQKGNDNTFGSPSDAQPSLKMLLNPAA